MGLETIIQSEVSQKGKNKYCMLTCGIWKNGVDHLIWKAEIDTGLENRCVDTKGEKGGVGGLGSDTYTVLMYRIGNLMRIHRVAPGTKALW